MLEEQPLVRKPVKERHKEVRERHGRMESRPEASQPSVCPSSVFNDPQHLTRAHLSSLLHTHTHSVISVTSHSLSPQSFVSLLCIKYLTKSKCLKSNLLRNKVFYSCMLLRSCRRNDCETRRLCKMRSTHLHLFLLVLVISLQV